MYPVTADFVSKMRADERRVLARIEIDYTDPFLDQSIQVQASEQANVSYPNQTADAVSEPFAKIASLDGSWVLDGTFALAPDPEEADTHQMGWWGSQLADENGNFAEPYPSLTVTHFARPIHSLRVVGDSARGEYPVNFRIDLYGPDDTLLYTEQVTGNTSVEWSKTLPSPVLDVTKQVLTITKWSHPGRQAKILEFFTSVQETYEGDDILLIHLLEEREVSQGSLPVGNISANEIDIRLDNSTRKFDAGNTQSPLYQLLKQNRRIRAWLGVEAENNYTDKPPTFTRNSIAYKFDGTQVAANQPRFEQGQFGQAVLVEEGTTNVVADPSFENADITANWNAASVANWAYTGMARVRDTTRKKYGSASVKCGDGATHGKGIAEKNQGTAAHAVSAGQIWTLSFDVYATNADTQYIALIRCYDSSGNNISNSVTPPSGWQYTSYYQALCFFQKVPGANAWYRITKQFTVPSGVAYVAISLQCYIGGDYYVWFDGVQFENKPYATSFIDGTRAAETLTIPTAGVLNPQEYTIEMWIRPSRARSAYLNYERVVEFYGTSGFSGVWLNNPSNGDGIAFVKNNAGKVSAKANWNAGDWIFVAFSQRSDGMHLWVGVAGTSLIHVSNTDTTPFNAEVTKILLGSNIYGSQSLNGLIDDLRISSIARTDEEIAAAYASRQPLPVDEWTTYKLTFNGSIYPVEKVWIPLGTFWSGDWSAPEDGVYAQTTGRDRLELLRKSTYSTSQVQQNTTLYDLAVAVLEDAGLKPEEYWVDPELQNYVVPYAYFEPQSHREALRKIAEACLGQVYCDRDGIVRVEGPSYLASKTEAELEITADDYFRKDNPVKWSEIANYIEVETQPLRPVDTPQEVYRSNEPVSIGAGQTISITAYYNETPCIDAVATLENAPSGCVIQEATYYAWGADVKVYSTTAGTFTLVINARPLKVLNKERAVAKDDANITDNGLIKYTFPANPLVQTREVAQTIANKLLATFKNPRRDVEVEWRGNPALLLGDRVKITDRNEQNDYYVVRQELEYSGALRARLSGRRAT